MSVCGLAACRPLARPSVHVFRLSTRFLSTRISYRIAAAYTGKNRPFKPDTNSFDFNPYNRIQKRGKRKRPDSGQDAFFVSRVGASGDVALGVADGVGGWEDSGVDPADFSHGFCDLMACAAYEYPTDHVLTAQALMQRGYEDICQEGVVTAGGSTACVAIGKQDGTLEVANLGDSGFLQLRLNAVHGYTEPQTHAFNTPYQLSIVPMHIQRQLMAFGGSHFCDFPSDAAVTRHSVRHGDVLVFATDGVWDNLSPQDTLRVVSKTMRGAGAWELQDHGVAVGELESTESTSLQNSLAVSIAAQAKAASINTTLDGPFAKEVRKYYPEENWKGGKVDDICVVVAVVVEE